jgi:prepilin-type N-terminal cleavage/methylation domain-containing protein
MSPAEGQRSARAGFKRALRRGYTMVEVMMGLAILAVGAAGIVSLQRFAVMGTMTSRHVTSATNVASSTIELMALEAGRWTNNGSSITPANMPWLGTALGAPNTWVGADTLRAFRMDGSPFPSAAALLNGDQVAYCAHVRAVYLGNAAAAGALDSADAARVEVRVFYSKTGRSVAPECRDWSGLMVTNLFNNTNQTALGISRSRSEYGVVYLTTVIRRNG